MNSYFADVGYVLYAREVINCVFRKQLNCFPLRIFFFLITSNISHVGIEVLTAVQMKLQSSVSTSYGQEVSLYSESSSPKAVYLNVSRGECLDKILK
jgi:hypothetical protein